MVVCGDDFWEMMMRDFLWLTVNMREVSACAWEPTRLTLKRLILVTLRTPEIYRFTNPHHQPSRFFGHGVSSSRVSLRQVTCKYRSTMVSSEGRLCYFWRSGNVLGPRRRIGGSCNQRHLCDIAWLFTHGEYCFLTLAYLLRQNRVFELKQ